MMNVNIQPNLAVFRPRFLAGLHRRVDELTACTVGLDQMEKLDHAMRLFHSIAGLAGTFGFPELTVIARRAERLCSSAIENHVSLTVWEELVILDAIVQLRRAASSALANAA